MDKLPNVIAVTGGKGGVGKTNVAVNLATSLALKNKKVLLVDTDIGLANVHILLGIQPKKTLSGLLTDQSMVEDLIYNHQLGFDILPASSGNTDIEELAIENIGGIISLLSKYNNYDILIIDTAAGVSKSVLNLVGAANQIVVVTCNEPTSLADAYALIKLLNYKLKKNKFKILVNMTNSDNEGHEVFAKLTNVSDRFLNVSLNYIGMIPMDKCVVKAIRKRKPVVGLYPKSKASQAIMKLSEKLLRSADQDFYNNGSLVFFNQYIKY